MPEKYNIENTGTSKKNNTYIYIQRLEAGPNKWDPMESIPWNNYQITESDMRIKTATFESPVYFDLTNGHRNVRIISSTHPNFGGVILSVDRDKKTGMYKYQCQDFNWMLNFKNYLVQIGSKTVYEIILKVFETYNIKKTGLKPIEAYKQGASNPMEKKPKVIFDKVVMSEIIRSLLYDNGVFIDFYFHHDGIPIFEPYTPEDWLGTGWYFTTTDLASLKLNFDITNVITEVKVKSNDPKVESTWYNSKDLLGVDLTAFYGITRTTIDNPVKPTTTASTAAGASSGIISVSKDTPVLVNCDNIRGYANDRKMINDCVAGLKAKGYTNVIAGNIGPDVKYHDIPKLPDGGAMLFICGGLCAGTFEDTAEKYYKTRLSKRKLIYGFLAPPVDDDLDQLAWLPRAHDDDFTRGAGGMKNPGQFLIDNGNPYVYGNSGTNIADNFASGGGGLKALIPGARIDTNPANLKPQSEWLNNGATTSSGDVTVDSSSASDVDAEKRKAIEVMTESARKLMSFELELPGGYPELHTNSFLWTELPEDFDLTNLKATSDAMTGDYTRHMGYELNRWYVERVVITNDADNGLKTSVQCNPFASSYSTYTKMMEDAINAYTQSTQKTETKPAETTPQVTDANVSTDVKTAALQIVGNNTDPNVKAKLIFDWVDKHIAYEGYYTNKYGYTSSDILRVKRANCWMTAHLLFDMWSAVNVKCNIQNGYASGPGWYSAHTWNQVQYNGQMVCCDAGRTSTGHFNGCGMTIHSASTLKKNY